VLIPLGLQAESPFLLFFIRLSYHFMGSSSVLFKMALLQSGFLAMFLGF
jgi:hypothetical protein